MSKKAARISINKLEATMQNNTIVVPMDGNPDVKIIIRRILPLQEVLQFVEDVVSSCIDMETGRYIPEIQAFTTRASVLTRYANFTLPKDPEKQYDLIYNTSAFQQVMGTIDGVQYNEILYSINERIKHETAMMEGALANQMAELTAKIDAFVNNSEELFGSIKGEDMSALVKNLTKATDVDEEKLVKAVFNAKKQEASVTAESPVVSFEENVVTLRKKKD